MKETICYVNGNVLPMKDASLPVQDLAILRGYGVFDFLRTYNRKPFHLRDHLLRLKRSANLIQIELPHPPDEIEAIILDLLARNNLPEANIRIVITGGVSNDSVNAVASSGLLVLVTPPRIYPEDYYQRGIKVITVETDRYLPLAKTINYIPALLALKKAKAQNAVEALYVNQQKHILEGTTTNFFVFHGERLITPKDNILPGVTRDVVLKLAKARFEVVERPILFEDVTQADGAFVTASNKEVMPVCQVNDVPVGDGFPGPNLRLLMQDFRELTRGQ